MVADRPEIEYDAPVPTWFKVGGRARALVTPITTDSLVGFVSGEREFPLVLGDGANLLVADEGVPHAVVSLRRGVFRDVTFGEDGAVHAGAGCTLSKLIHDTARLGLSGMEGLIGIPATLGGAVVMNAGGGLGEIASCVEAVRLLHPDGSVERRPASDIRFGYRQSGLGGAIVTSVELRLKRDDPEACRAQVRDAMAYKSRTQPLASDSAGCCFRNPTLERDVEGIGVAGARVSAGLLIDRAGGKGLSRGGATVSPIHANFIVTAPGATASDVLDTMRAARDLVHARFGVLIEPEVVIWGASL